MFQSIFLISAGAAIGASLRWGLGLWLNSLFSSLAFGTLVANFIGCFLMGILLAAFWTFPQFSPEWRLFLVTGFLGALTTFSSFSGEVIELAEKVLRKKFPNYSEPQPIKSKQKIWQYMLSHGFYSEEFSDFIGNGIED